ncbi:MAG: ECF transporter S component [FCB group bacterium]|nr:ECF transporter S component [FCB group bacterium]
MQSSSYPQNPSLLKVKMAVFTGLCAAVSAAVGFAFIAVPNFEMITAAIFLSGMLLGPARGIIVGVVAEFMFSVLNPMGMAFPPLLIAQLFGMAVSGFTGGLIVQLAKNSKPVVKGVIWGAAGFMITLNFDFWTTMSFPLSAGFNWEQTITTLKMGIPFAIPHLTGNTLIFAVVILPAFERLNRIVSYRSLAAAILLLTVIPPATHAQETEYSLNTSEWESVYYEDLPDVIGLIPGFYHYDLALTGQQQYMFKIGGDPVFTLYGMPLNDAMTGLFDHTLVSAGYVDALQIGSGYNDGFVSAGDVIRSSTYKVDPDLPYSRINYRDGYYGLGIADFIFAQRVGDYLGFQIGGKVSEFNGRFGNSVHLGQQIRSSLYWYRPDGWNVRGTYISNNQRNEITHTLDRRLLHRSDFFLSATADSTEHQTSITAHFYTSENDYFDRPDQIEGAFRFKIIRKMNAAGFSLHPMLYFNWYRVQTGNGFEENQPSLLASVSADRPLSGRLNSSLAVSLEYGRDFLPAISTGLDYAFSKELKLGGTLSRSSRSPVPIHRIYSLQTSDYFLPGSPVWEAQANDPIAANRDLKPETVSSARISAEIDLFSTVNVNAAVFYKYLVNAIDLKWNNFSAKYDWYNADKREIPGAEVLIQTRRFKGFSFRTAQTFQNPEQLDNFIPQYWSNCKLDYSSRAGSTALIYTIELHGKYYGVREGEIGGVHKTLGDDNVWGVRFIFNIHDFTLFWGNENIFSRQYELIPGYRMMHREEIWGINWVFWD